MSALIATTTSSINLNGFTATLVVSVSQNDYKFELSLTDGNDTITLPICEPTIDSYCSECDKCHEHELAKPNIKQPEAPKIESPQPKAPAVEPKAPEKSIDQLPTTNSVHSAYIKKKLDAIQAANGKLEKVPIAIELFTYLAGHIDFINEHDRFKRVVIEKCYEFKRENSEFKELMTVTDYLLTNLGQPLTNPPLSQNEIENVSRIINDKLRDINSVYSLEFRAKKTTDLLDYLSTKIEYINHHDGLKNTIIDKCYQFKEQHPTLKNVVESADKLLGKLSASNVTASTNVPNANKSPSFSVGYVVLDRILQHAIKKEERKLANDSRNNSRRSARLAKKAKVNYTN